MMIRFGRIVSSVRFWLVTTLSLLIAAALLTLGGIVGVQSASAAQAPIGLGSADSFAVLGASTVTNTGNTVISGDLGVNPGTAITGFPPGVLTPGSTVYEPSAVASPNPATVDPGLLVSASAAVGTAFTNAANATPSTHLPGGDNQLGTAGTITPGVYNFTAATTANLTGVVTLDGNGVYIFQASSSLQTASGSAIVLEAGAQPGCVFWEVGSSATLGSASTFVGTILAADSITANTGADVTGRLLVETAAVTLDDNLITVPPDCVVAPPVVTIPPVTIPPVTIPPVTIPPVTIPPVTIPPVVIPPVVVPPVVVPPVVVPPVVAPVTVAPAAIPAAVTPVVVPAVTAPAPVGVAPAAGVSSAPASTGSSRAEAAGGATPSAVVTPSGSPQTGFGGASRSGPNPLLLAFGGLALVGALGAATQGLRRRRIVGVQDDGLDGTE